MVIHTSKIEGEVIDRRTLDEIMRFAPNGDYSITIETRKQWRKRQGRTNDQNALMWAYFRDIARLLNNENGGDYWNAKRLHDYLCSKWPVEEITPDGELWLTPLKTSELTRSQMSDFLHKVQAWMATEYGCDVPLPDDDNYAEFRNFMDTI